MSTRTCQECGAELLHPRAEYCKNPDCQSVRKFAKSIRSQNVFRRKIGQIEYKMPETYPQVEFNRRGLAKNPDIFARLVKVKPTGTHENACDRCPYIDNCRRRIHLGLHVACESASKMERERVEKSPELIYNLRILASEVINS